MTPNEAREFESMQVLPGLDKPRIPLNYKTVGTDDEADKDLLAELKLKMVMRIYKVSRARAAAIIAGRAGERQALEEAREAKRARCLNGDETMTAEDFFNL